MRWHDVVIVGGGLAGSACARMLAASGVDVVAFERDRFPRSKVCGEFLSPGAVTSLDRLGLLDTVRAAGAVQVQSVRLHIFGATEEFSLVAPGLGVSRRTLDALLAQNAPVVTGLMVRDVSRANGHFRVSAAEHAVECRILIDASGKASRLSRALPVQEFGVQYHTPGSGGSVLEFRFDRGCYGGSVGVEGGQTNHCFLVARNRLHDFGPKEKLVTGPLVYDRIAGPYLAVGDALGMIDPFCGEGMRHALDTGILAAEVVSAALAHTQDYAWIRREFRERCEFRWARKRRLARWVRRAVRHPWLVRNSAAFAPWVLRELWK